MITKSYSEVLMVFSKNSSPNNMGGVSLETQNLIQKYQEAFNRQPQSPERSVIHVDEIASRLASFYERMRGIIDWKEEHLIRRTAIERGLKRRMVSNLSKSSLIPKLKPEEIAEPLVMELIRGGHFPNDEIPRRKLIYVERALRKYIRILENSPLATNTLSLGIKERVNFYDWVLEICACEIEEILDPPDRQNALIEYMTNLMGKRIEVIPRGVITEEEKGVLTYIAVHRTLFHLDSPIISYHLLKYRYPQWPNLPESLLEEVAKNILLIQENIKKYLEHPLSTRFFGVCEKYDTLFLILGDVLDELANAPSEIPQRISEPIGLRRLIKSAYDKKLSTLKARLFRMAAYSTLSVFVAGGFSLFIVEVPLAKLFYGRFNLTAIFVDMMLPTLLMYLLVAMVKPPKKSNFDIVLSEIMKIVYQQKESDVYEVKAEKKRRPLIIFIVSLLYILGGCVSLGIVFWIFHIAHIPITSVYIDTLNVAVIVFAALVVKQRAKELVVEDKTTFWELLLDTLSVPVAKVGQWLSNKWKEYNIVSVFFAILIDTPFLTLIGLVENWNSFIRERKAEIH